MEKDQNSYKSYPRVLVNLNQRQLEIAREKAKEADLKLSTFVRTCFTKYMRQQGVDL